MKALDYMIEKGIFEYQCDFWSGGEHDGNCESVKNVSGQINYKGEIFVVSHYSGRRGFGGMDDGSPDGVKITRIKIVGKV